MCCVSSDRVCQFWPQNYILKVRVSHRKRERPAPALGGGLVIWLKSPKLGEVMNAGGQSQGRAGLKAS